MKRIIVIIALLVFTSCATSSEDLASNKKQHTFVLVHGVSGGAWDWKAVGEHLSAKGHRVYRPTLTGLGERYHLSNSEINLTTHINDIVNVILFEDLQDVVLVGHSYGGMVITGVMDRIPERIHHVTFLDAKVPEDGMSMTEGQGIPPEHQVIDGRVHFSWLKPTDSFPRDVEHPVKTLTEAVSYKNPAAKKLNVSYVAFVAPGVSKVDRAKDPSWARAEKRGWTIRTYAGNHVIYRTEPAKFSAFLEETVKDKNK